MLLCCVFYLALMEKRMESMVGRVVALVCNFSSVGMLLAALDLESFWIYASFSCFDQTHLRILGFFAQDFCVLWGMVLGERLTVLLIEQHICVFYFILFCGALWFFFFSHRINADVLCKTVLDLWVLNCSCVAEWVLTTNFSIWGHRYVQEKSSPHW